mgnify:FL=1
MFILALVDLSRITLSLLKSLHSPWRRPLQLTVVRKIDMEKGEFVLA